jgi:hypothetical protein
VLYVDLNIFMNINHAYLPQVYVACGYNWAFTILSCYMLKLFSCSGLAIFRVNVNIDVTVEAHMGCRTYCYLVVRVHIE